MLTKNTIFNRLTKVILHYEKGVRLLETYFHLETAVQASKDSVYRHAHRIVATELEATAPTGALVKRRKWTGFRRMFSFLGF
jgi:hypothetical protein